MKFSRKATAEDFIRENSEWERLLPSEVVSEVATRNDGANRFKGVGIAAYRRHTYCGIEQAKQVIAEYISFLSALEDFSNGKDVFVQY